MTANCLQLLRDDFYRIVIQSKETISATSWTHVYVHVCEVPHKLITMNKGYMIAYKEKSIETNINRTHLVTVLFALFT